MRIQSRTWIFALGMMGALSLLGCGQRKTESQATKQAPEQVQPSGAEAQSSEGGAAMTPAGSIAGIWAQITEEQGKLSAAIQNGQLKDVHHLAFGIRDLVVAAADKAVESTPAVAPKLKELVDQVKASAGRLDELGDSGNLSGTQAEQAKLNTTLDAIKAIVIPG